MPLPSASPGMPVARRSKYTAERASAILGGVREGLTYRLAAAVAGISPDTLTRWKDRYPDFAARLMAVEAEAAHDALKLIRRAGHDDWRAAAWILEHRHPEDYGRQVAQLNVAGRIEHRHYDFSLFTPQEQARLDELAAKLEAGQLEAGQVEP
jgi:transposase-like protein